VQVHNGFEMLWAPTIVTIETLLLFFLTSTICQHLNYKLTLARDAIRHELRFRTTNPPSSAVHFNHHKVQKSMFASKASGTVRDGTLG
jgi:hypothetical protein